METPGVADIRNALARIGKPIRVASSTDGFRLLNAEDFAGVPSAAFAPAIGLESFGDASFRADHQLRYAYVSGAMANGIGSEAIVEAMGEAGMLGFFGAAGLSPSRVEQAVDRIQSRLGDKPYGFNLIHSPAETDLETHVVDLYLRRGVRTIEASAYLDLTLPVIRYRLHGIHRGPNGSIVTPNRIVAKVSRVEVATRFLSPPADKYLRELTNRGEITAEQAELAKQIPVAQDLTAEADSGGHTDNRPAITLVPTMLALRDRLAEQFQYRVPLRVGAAGGIATPASTAAAFAMGAAYVVTGSINQACVESGSSDLVRGMLAEAQQADVIMAPAADMFEMGVRVQVLKRGTLFAMRGAKLFELYRIYPSLEDLPTEERARLERDIFRAPLDDIWKQTAAFFQQRDPKQLERANRDAKHKMALVFRWYLGHASRWANVGEPTRKIDYQVWCGPAMGAFNEWAAGTFLEEAKNRKVVTLAMNLLYGAAVLTRYQILRLQGLTLPGDCPVKPREVAEIRRLVGDIAD